jgi:hypothetical protein
VPAQVPADQPDGAAPVPAAAPQTAFGGFSIWKMILIFLGINFALNLFKSGPKMKAEDFQNIDGTPKIFNNAYQNLFRPN